MNFKHQTSTLVLLLVLVCGCAGVSHGQVASTVDEERLACNGTTKTFTFHFGVWQTSEVRVVKYTLATGAMSVLTENSDYTVTLPNGDGWLVPGGTITTLSATAYPSTYCLVVSRTLTLTQPGHYTTQTSITPKNLQDDFDRMVLLIQFLQRQIDRALRFVVDANIADANFAAGDEKRSGYLYMLNGKPTLITAEPNGTVTNEMVISLGEVAGDANDVLILDPANPLRVKNAPMSTRSKAILADANGPERRFQFNVKDFGATGKGVTDDTAAIQAAIDLAEASGGTVFIPRGVYLTGQLEIDAGITIIGEGSYSRNTSYYYDFTRGTTLAYTGTGGSIINVNPSCLYGLFIRNVSFVEYETGMESGAVVYYDKGQQNDANGLNIEPAAVYGVHNVVLEECSFMRLYRGVYMNGGASNYNREQVRMTRCTFEFNTRGLEIRGTGTTQTDLEQCRFYAERWGEYGIYVYLGTVNVKGKTYFYGRNLGRPDTDTWPAYKGDIWIRYGYAYLENLYSESETGNFLVNEYVSSTGATTAVNNCYSRAALRPVEIAHFVDLGGGETRVDCSDNHRFYEGSRVRISGTTNYDGLYIVEAADLVDLDSFAITHAFVADDATGSADDSWDFLTGVTSTTGGGWFTFTGCSFRRPVLAQADRTKITAVGSYFGEGLYDEANQLAHINMIGCITDTDGAGVGVSESNPLHIQPRDTAPRQKVENDIYVDDGTNTTHGYSGFRRYTGSAWEDLGDPYPQVAAIVDLSNAQIKDLADTAVELVAAPGAGKWLEFCGASLWLDYGSNALAEPSSPDNLSIRYTDESGAVASTDIVASGFITATADTGAFATPDSIAGTAASSLVNKALVLVNTGGDYTGNAGNDTVIRVIVHYRVHSGLGL